MTSRSSDLKLIQGTPLRLRPPDDLTKAEKQVFVEIVGSVDAGHFRQTDLPLLASYAVAVCQERTANQRLRVDGYVVKDGTKISPWVVVAEKAHRAMMALSTRLRLSPQSRARTKVKPDKISAYERMRLEEDEEDDARN